MDLIIPSNGLIAWQIAGFLVSAGYFGFVIYALVDLIRSDIRQHHMKLIWAFMILMIPIIGPFIYLALKSGIKRRSRRFNPDFSRNVN